MVAPVEERPQGADDHDNEDDDDDDSMGSSYDSEADDSSFGSDMEVEAQRLMDALQDGGAVQVVGGNPAAGAAAPVVARPPQEVWTEFVSSVENSANASLKVTDKMVAWVAETTNDDDRIALTETLCNDLIRAVEAGFVIIHVILGRVFLTLLTPSQHESLYKAILMKHAATITYWKIGSDDSTETCGIPTTALWQCMSSPEVVAGVGWTNLTELEIRGIDITTEAQLNLMLHFIDRAPKIRQFNVLGMVMTDVLVATEGFFDKLVARVETIPGFDELQLCRTVGSTIMTTTKNAVVPSPPLISSAALEHLLSIKPKWWRMALDGMALDDRHLHIIGAALKEKKDCKMNDMLSLQDNPKVTPKGLQALYTVCLAKQRMGLVLSDDPSWTATFDLVRPLNNLHRRLEYIKEDGSGGYRSKDKWIEWLVVLNTLPWIGEARKLNYMWFALLEQPELIDTSSH